jgi:hypothetical protein
MDLGAQFDQLSGSVGALWFVALVSASFVRIFEAARPKPTFGEPAKDARGFGLFVMVLSLLTPLLLFMHGFVRAPDALGAVTTLIVGPFWARPSSAGSLAPSRHRSAKGSIASRLTSRPPCSR